MDFLPLFALRSWMLAIVLASLQGCAGESALLKDTLSLTFANQAVDITKKQNLNPNYRYLRVVHQGRPLLLVLGFLEQPKASLGNAVDPIEVWYSGQGEVFKLQSGRLIATAGLSQNVVGMRLGLEAQWAQVLSSVAAGGYAYQRSRDVMPGYQFNYRDEVAVQRVSRPIQAQPVGVLGDDLVWIKEQYRSQSAQPLPPSYFAFTAADVGSKQPEVRYSIQCIAPDLCFSFQNWTLADHAKAQP